jgi:hypothetical protein
MDCKPEPAGGDLARTGHALAVPRLEQNVPSASGAPFQVTVPVTSQVGEPAEPQPASKHTARHRPDKSGGPLAALEIARQQYLDRPDIVTEGTGTLDRLAAGLLRGHTWYFWRE